MHIITPTLNHRPGAFRARLGGVVVIFPLGSGGNLGFQGCSTQTETSTFADELT